MNIGSVRMTERHLKNDPPTEGQIAEAVADIDAHIDEAFKTVPAGKTHTIIGVSGTVTTMTALAMGLTEYDHTAVVGGGALVWNRVLAKVSEAAYEDHGQRIDSFMASEHGLLDGIVLDYGKRLLAAR